MDLPTKLRILRKLCRFSQKKVAELSGVHVKTISSFETGSRIGSLKVAQLQKLLFVYGVTDEEFWSAKFEQDLQRGFNPLLFQAHALQFMQSNNK